MTSHKHKSLCFFLMRRRCPCGNAVVHSDQSLCPLHKNRLVSACLGFVRIAPDPALQSHGWLPKNMLPAITHFSFGQVAGFLGSQSAKSAGSDSGSAAASMRCGRIPRVELAKEFGAEGLESFVEISGEFLLEVASSPLGRGWLVVSQQFTLSRAVQCMTEPAGGPFLAGSASFQLPLVSDAGSVAKHESCRRTKVYPPCSEARMLTTCRKWKVGSWAFDGDG